MKITVIIACAGTGSRLKTSVPKQFSEICGKEMLAYSLEVFNKTIAVDQIIIGTLHKEKVSKIIEIFDMKKVSHITEGGATRNETIKKALEKATGDIILVHDAARPFITVDLVEKVIDKVKETGAAILATKAVDTIKIAQAGIVKETTDRENTWLAQTPQAFTRELLEKSQIYSGTDDASQVENIAEVSIVESTRENFKITTIEDLEYANFLMSKKNKEKVELKSRENSTKVMIYTDGACTGNPGPGGFGVVLMAGELRKEASCGYKNTTNNRMELKAVITGLSLLKKQSEVELFTDSRYIVDAITKKWVYNWKAKGWKRSNGENALNIDLWQQLLLILETHKVNFNWVKGHAGNKENERCDELARKAAENPTEEDVHNF